MRRIAIVGAGQAGLQLGLGLLAQGYQVSITTNRTAEQIRAGKVMSSQCMFNTALQTERDLGLNFWEEQCPAVEGIGLTVPNPQQPGSKLIDWSARLERYAQAVDQRLKMPAWMDEFVRRGGELKIEDVSIAELERLAASHDLVLLAAGKGEIVNQFPKDAERTRFNQPQRALALTYVKGMTPMSPYSRCEIMVFEGIPGGPMDCWQDVQTPEQHLQRSLEIVRRYVPWEACRADRRRRRAGRALHADGTQAGAGTALGPAGVRHGRCPGGQRSDHRAGLQQRRQVQQGDALPILGLRPARGWLDQQHAAATA